MNLFLIVIKPSEPEDLTLCPSYLGKIGNVAPLTEDSYLLLTEQTATYVRDYIKNQLMPHRIFVTKVKHGAAWANIIPQNDLVKEWYSVID